jgi:polyhydroxyalkanoate synthase
VLGSGGHIAGIVSPPGPKAWHMVAPGTPAQGDGERGPASAELWHASAERRSGSWWEDWARWSDANSGPMRNPPETGSAKYPVLGDGPGTYVRT